MDTKSIGETLRNLRGVRTQNEVANACNITVQALSSYERGERIPRDEVKIRLASFYGLTVQDLFFAFDRHVM